MLPGRELLAATAWGGGEGHCMRLLQLGGNGQAADALHHWHNPSWQVVYGLMQNRAECSYEHCCDLN